MILYLTNVYGQSLEFFKILSQVIILMGQIKFSISLDHHWFVFHQQQFQPGTHPPAWLAGVLEKRIQMLQVRGPTRHLLPVSSLPVGCDRVSLSVLS